MLLRKSQATVIVDAKTMSFNEAAALLLRKYWDRPRKKDKANGFNEAAALLLRKYGCALYHAAVPARFNEAAALLLRKCRSRPCPP